LGVEELEVLVARAQETLEQVLYLIL
jgi:hypothetical protein